MKDALISSDVLESPINTEMDASLQNKQQNNVIAIKEFYLQCMAETKEKVDRLGAEVTQRQDKMRLLNDVIVEINNLTNEKNELNISKEIKLQEKIRVLQELGVNIKGDKLQFNAIERDRLLENLHLTCNNWVNENKNQTQKIEILMKELDRVMLLLKEAEKNHHRDIRGMAARVK